MMKIFPELAMQMFFKNNVRDKIDSLDVLLTLNKLLCYLFTYSGISIKFNKKAGKTKNNIKYKNEIESKM